MKLTTFLLLVSVFGVLANKSYSQTLSLKMKETTLKEVLSKIEDISGYNFLYSEKFIDVQRKVSINVDNKELDEVLKSLFSDINIDFERKNRIIILSQNTGASVQQQKTITGKVTDSSGAPLPGVTVVVKGTTTGTITDFDGKYTLANIPGDATLVFSFVGMKGQEITVNGKTTINVQLEEESIGIEEVVAVGYGTIRKSDLTSAIAKVGGDDLQSRPVSRVDQALQGQLAGVQVQQSGGKPGKNATIRVRGIGSISAGNDPLYVVDGFPVDAETFANLNLSNIESIEVLKDAASASIYGSRGSNGVILVTTKRGEKGQELKINLNAYTGISNIERKLPLMSGSEYVSFLADNRDDAYLQSGGDLSVLPLDRPYSYMYDQNWINNPESVPNYDHQDAILQTGITMSYQLAMSGSTNKVRYLVSGEYFNQTGIVKNTGYKRYSCISNIDVDMTKFLTLGVSLMPSFIVAEDKNTEGKGGLIHQVLRSVPVLSPRLGYWGESEPFSTFLLVNDTPGQLAILEHLKDREERGQIVANAYAQISFFPELKFKTSINANYYNTRRDQFENQIIVRTGSPSGKNWNTQVTNWLNENILTYNKRFDKHSIGAVAGFTAQKNAYKYSYISGTGFPNDYVSTLNAASSWTASTSMSEWSLLSYLSRVNYSFDDKYLFSASIRADGSSRFGADTKWGWFPSVSTGWRIDEESFMEDFAFVNRLKLRGSWGKTGNDAIGNYGAIGLMGTSAYLFGVSEELIGGAYPSSISNPNLSWEKTSTTDFGLDVGLFGNRINFTLDYYNKQTSDLLLDVPVAAITGFTYETQNYGKVENKGWEFELSTVNIDRAFKWSSNINFSFNKNTVKQLGPNNAPIIDGDWINSITTVGYPIGSFYVYKQTGVYNTQEEIDATPHKSGSRPGDVIIEDYNKDEGISSKDRQIFGSNIPKYFFGITNQLNYKGIDFSIFFNGVGGNEVANEIGREYDSPRNSHINHLTLWNNRWRSPEDPGDGMTPRATDKVTGLSKEFTNRNLFDGSYIRLKNIMLGYTFSKTLTTKMGISNLRAYLQVENPYIWDHYDAGYTPEVDLNNGDALDAGKDYGVYPVSRTFLFGLNVAF